VLLVPLLLAGIRFRSGMDSATAALTFERDMAQAIQLLSSGKARESLDVLERAEQLNADVFVLHNNRCIAHAQLGEVSAAVRACRRALELDPGSQLARNNLAWVQTLEPTARR
jgi:Flp pilus assembly protein TadD